MIFYVQYFKLEIENHFQIYNTMSEYHTKQKQIVLKLIKNLENDFTAKSLHEKLDGKIGLTTIYRVIESLEKEGKLIKTTQDNTAKYQYIEPCEDEDHFYLKCENCGRLEHVDCEKVQGLTTHIANEHHFTPTQTHLTISGLCERCSK